MGGGLTLIFRRVIFWCHLISGLTVGAVLFIMAVTGAVLAFAPQFEEASEKNVRYVTALEKRIPYNQIISRTSVSSGKIPAIGLIIKSDPASSVVVQFGRGKSVYVNPYTGEILGGASKVHDFMHLIEDIHRRLALAAKGEALTKACNVVFLFMIISGFYLWWPRNWNPLAVKASFVFNPSLKGKARDWNRHNVAGFWSLPLLLVIVLTGLIMSYRWSNAAFFRILGSEPPQQQQKGPGVPAGGKGEAPMPIHDFNWDAFIASASAKLPVWESMTLRMPPKPDAPVSIFVQGASGPKFARSQMMLDPKTAEVTKWEPFHELNTARRGRIWVRYLHTGEAFGLVSQIFAFLGACAAAFLIWTGFSMSWHRFFRKKPAPIKS